MPKLSKEKKQYKLISSNYQLRNIKSNLILKIIFNYISERKKLETIKYNESIQKRINININNYKTFSEKYSSIVIEIIPMKNIYDKFIYIEEEDDEKYYHIYFNDKKKKEIKRTSLNENDKVSKINIIINYQVESFSNLFKHCKCIESINFKIFYRNNITDMYCMFKGCSSLKELNLNNFNTDNVTDMSCMFRECSSLKKLNLNNFNTTNVTNMKYVLWMLIIKRIKSQ